MRVNRSFALRLAQVALGLGVLALFAGVADPDSSMLLTGIGLTFGGWACGSALRTALAPVRPSWWRTATEVAALAAVLLASMLQTRFWDVLATHPVSTAVIPLGSVAAYITAKKGGRALRTRG